MEQKEIFDVTSSYLTEALHHGCPDPKTGEIQTEFIVREISGEEEDLIRAGGSHHIRHSRILFNCLVAIGTISDRKDLYRAVTEMTTLDRLVVLIAIRRATYLDKYRMQVELPDDAGEPSPKWYTVDLKKDLDHTYGKTGGKLSFEEVIKVSRGDEVRECPISWHIMRGKDEQWLEGVRSVLADTPRPTIELLGRVDRIASRVIERPDPNLSHKELEEKMDEILTFLKRLPGPLRNAMRHRFDEVEGDLDLTLEFEYKDKEDKKQIFSTFLDPSQPGFFFPPVT